LFYGNNIPATILSFGHFLNWFTEKKIGISFIHVLHNIFAAYENLLTKKNVSNKAQLCAHHEMNMGWSCVWNLDKVAEESFKKADCPSDGLKWKIYSFTEETSRMTQMLIGIKWVNTKV
jgi:hypothetical protein